MKFASIAAGVLLATTSTAGFAQAEMKAKETTEKAETKVVPTIDMAIETLVADERSKAVLEKHLPGISDHPSYGQFKSMTLIELQPWSGGLITDEGIAKIKEDLGAIEAAE